MYKCKNCGYVHWLENLPEKCPKCFSKKEVFQLLSEEESSKIEESLLTNELLIEMIDTLNKLLDISEEGLEDNLDEGCKKIFSSIYKQSIEHIQEIKAEIETHIKNNKWG